MRDRVSARRLSYGRLIRREGRQTTPVDGSRDKRALKTGGGWHEYGNSIWRMRCRAMAARCRAASYSEGRGAGL